MSDNLRNFLSAGGLLRQFGSRESREPSAGLNRPRRYVVAAGLAGLALLLRFAFDGVLGDGHGFVLPLLAVMSAAWYGGFGPGLLALALGGGGFVALFINSDGSADVRNAIAPQVDLALFAFCGVVAAALGQAQRSARLAAEVATADLHESNRHLARSQWNTTEALTQLDAFLTHAPVGLAFYDRDLRYVRINNYLAAANRRPAADHLGKTIPEMVPDIPTAVVAAFARVLESGEPMRDLAVLGTTGPDSVWHVSAFPASDPHGVTVGLAVVAQDVTERARQERAVADSEARFRRLADAMPQIVYVSRPDGTQEYLNRRWYEYTGSTDDSADGIAGLIHPDDRPRLLADYARTAAAGIEFASEFRLRRATDGAYRWFLTRSVPVRNAAGAIVNWYGTSTDIDDQKRAAEALQASDADLRQAQRVAHVGSWRWYPAADAVVGSDELSRIYGLDPAAGIPPVAEQDGSLYPHDSWVRVNEAVQATAVTGVPFEMDLPALRRGVPIWVTVRSEAELDAAGRVTCLRGTVQDITDRKAAEEALATSESRLRLAVQVSGLAVAEVDYLSDTVRLSAEAAVLLGRPAEAQTVPRGDIHAQVHPDDRAELAARIADSFDPAGGGGFAMEHRVVRLDGTVRWHAVRKQVDFAGGRPVRSLLVMFDVTDRKRAEGRQRLLADLAAATQPLDDPAAVVATAARLLGEHLGADRCVYVEVDADGSQFDVLGDHCRGVHTFVGRYPLTVFGAEFARLVHAGQPYIVADAETDPRVTPADREAYRQVDIRAVVAVPLTNGGRLVAGLAVHQTVARAWTPDELELVQQVAGRCREAIERTRVARELAASEARFRGLADTVPLVIFEADLTGRVTFLNRYYEEYTGSPAADRTADGWGPHVRPDQLPRLTSNWADAVAGKAAFHDLYPLRRHDGRYRWFTSSARLVCRPDGTPDRWVGVSADVHDRVEAEEALAATQRTLTMSLAIANASVYSWDVATDRATTRRAHPTDPGVLAISQPQTLAQRLAAVHPDDREGVRAAFDAARAGGRPFSLQFRVGDRDKGWRWTESRGQFEYAPDGTPVRAIGVRLDIHDRKTAEDAARQADLQFRAMADSIPQMAWMADPTGAIDWYNARWYEYTGTTFDQMQGWGWQAVHFPDEVERVTAKFMRHVSAGTVWEDTCRLRGADGAYRWFLSRARPIRDDAGTVLRWFGTNTDVTAQRQLEADLRAAGERFRFLDALGQATRATDPRATLAATARLLGEHLGATRCAYADVFADGDRFAIRHDWTDGAATTVGEYTLGRFGSKAVADLTANRPLVLADVDRELPAADGADTFNAIGVKAIVCCPLVKDGRLAALMAVHQAAPRDWTPAEVSLVTEVVERSWAHVERARAQDEAREAAGRFRTLAESVPALVWSCDAAGHADYHSSRWEEYTGRPGAELGDSGWNKSVHPDDLTADRRAAWDHSFATGAAFAVEYRLRRHDGAYRWHLSQARPQRDAGGRVVRWYGTVTDIDDQKRLEADLRQKSAILDTINNHTPTLVYVKDLAGRAVQYNPATLAAIGKTAAEVVGRTDAEYMPAEAAAAVMANDRRVIETGEVLTTEEPVDDTTDRTFLSIKAPHRENGRVVGLIGVSVDITAQKRLERAARAAADRFRTLTEAIPQLVFNADADGQVSYFNTRWKEYTGLTQPDALANWWQQVIHPADAPALQASWRRAMRDEAEPFSHEVRVKRAADAAYRWFLTVVVPLRNPAGGVDQWIGSLSDIHDLKTAEETVRASEMRFRQLVEAVPNLVWVTDAAGRITQLNRYWVEYTGRPLEELLSDGWVSLLHPDDAAAAVAAWQAAVRHRSPFANEHRFRTAAGGYRWQLARGVPVAGVDGRLSQWFGTCTDIDDQKRAAELLDSQVKERTAELARSNGELEKFAYVASHDLQEPLRKVQAFGDRLASRFAPGLGPDGKDYIERMQASAARMQTLINDLLAFARVTSRPKAFAAVPLGPLVDGVLSDLETLLTRTGAVVRVDDLPTVAGDPGQLRQLFQNLLANACKFHRPGHPPWVVVTAERLDGLAAADPPPGLPAGWRLVVSDDGIGFEQQYADKIFEVFQRLHGRGEYEGTGIGLAICRKIVERHGGTITARGRPGEGATFAVDLPDPPGVPPQ